jgi:hypothetical protein
MEREQIITKAKEAAQAMVDPSFSNQNIDQIVGPVVAELSRSEYNLYVVTLNRALSELTHIEEEKND